MIKAPSAKYLNVSTETEKNRLKIGLTSYLNQTKLETNKFQGSNSYFINYNKNYFKNYKKNTSQLI